MQDLGIQAEVLYLSKQNKEIISTIEAELDK